MDYRPIRNRFILPLTALTVLACLAPFPASAGDTWSLRAFGAWVDPDLDFRTTNEEGDLISAGTDSAFGLGVSGEYRFSHRFGAELAVLRANPDIDLFYQFNLIPASFTTTDDLAMTPIMLGLNVHLLPPDKRPDLYIAPLFSYVQYGDLTFEVAETFEVGGIPVPLEETIEVSVSSDVAYGAALGLDIPFSFSPWAVSAAARYLWTDLSISESEGGSEKMSYNTLIVTLGIRYSF